MYLVGDTHILEESTIRLYGVNEEKHHRLFPLRGILYVFAQGRHNAGCSCVTIVFLHSEITVPVFIYHFATFVPNRYG